MTQTATNAAAQGKAVSGKKNKLHLIESARCKSCGLCVTACPKQTLGIGSSLNHQGYAYVVQVTPEKCVKCNICRVVCPDVAIGVISD